MNNSENIFDFLERIRKSDIPEDLVSQKVAFFLRERAREKAIPYSGHFELTPLCNLDCKMCYVHLNSDQLNDHTILTAEEWISLFQQAIEAGMLKATLSGGECLAYPWFNDVFLFLKSKGVFTTILTNGVLLDTDRIEFFLEHRPDKIQISLYGSSDTVYEEVTGKRAFSTVMNNIIAAQKANLPIKISVTPNKYIVKDLKNVIRLVKDIDLPYAINLGLMTPRSDTGREKSENDIGVDEYIEIFRYNRALNNRDVKHVSVISRPDTSRSGYTYGGLKCGAGRSTFSINWFGDMHPCVQMVSIGAKPLVNGFLDSWKTINKEVRAYPRFIACDNCIYGHACNFCAAENEKMGSCFILNQGWCEKTWKMVENGLRSPLTDSYCV